VSKLRRIPDIERTATMLDLVRWHYPQDDSHVIIEEVGPGTGWSAERRWADVLALSVWPSKGMTLDGYEIKASKADLKKELSDPTKHEAVARYCDTWTLVAWDESILVDGIPESWGITVTEEGANGRQLRQVRKPAKRQPEPWPRSFICSLVRNANQQSAHAAYVARAVIEASTRSYRDGKRNMEANVRAQLHPLCRLLFGNDTWRWPPESNDIEAVLKLAAERLAQGELRITA
jgi:hypothetical protein